MPTAPAAPAAAPQPLLPDTSIVKLQIVDAPTSVEIGRTVRLRAVGQYADGKLLDVSSAVAWRSMSPGVCSVAADGTVSGVAAGTAIVEASLRDVSATVPVACGFIVTASVHENAPTADVMLPGAAVVVVGGPHAGLTLTTDNRGQVALPPVAAPGFRIQFKMRGYDDADYQIEHLPRESHLDIGMMPVPGVLVDFLAQPATYPSIPCDKIVVFETHRAGRVHAEARIPSGMGSIHVYDYYKTWLDLHVGSGRPLAAVADAVLPPGTYTAYASAACGAGRTFTLERQP